MAEKSKAEREELKRDLRYAGYSIKRIADELMISGSYVTRIIRGSKQNTRIEDHIAAILQKKPGDIWPHRITDDES
jgi:lambda repressor-like predicted transcriptional regulator